MNVITRILMERDNITEHDAYAIALEAAIEFDMGADPEQVVMEHFGLESTYVWDFFELIDEVAPFAIF